MRYNSCYRPDRTRAETRKGSESIGRRVIGREKVEDIGVNEGYRGYKVATRKVIEGVKADTEEREK